MTIDIGPPHQEQDHQDPSPIQIFYATETGTSHSLSQSLHRSLLLHHLPSLPPLSISSLDPLSLPLLTSPLIFIVSTTGNGEPPRPLRPLWDLLLRRDLEGSDVLGDVVFQVFGVGDSGYERFNWAGKGMRRGLLRLGGREILEDIKGEACWGDERSAGGLESTLHPFSESLISALTPLYYPTSSPPLPLPSAHLFPPVHKVIVLPPSPESTPSPSSFPSTPPVEPDPTSSPSTLLDNLEISPESSKVASESQTDSSLSHGPISSLTGRESGWRSGTLTKFEQMTAPEWEQDVRLVEISTQEGLIYSPGSILQVIPSNTKEVVERFRELQPHLPPLETMLSFQPNSDHPAYAYSHAHSTSSDDPSSSFPSPLDALSNPFGSLPLTLFSLLTHHLDLTSVPTRSFFLALRQHTSDPREIERLDEFLSLANNFEGLDDIYDYATRPRRTCLEVLSDFRGVKVPVEYLGEVFGRMRRREFSIAGSALGHPGKVELAIAMVGYKTGLKVRRVGLCTSWLASLPIGSPMPFRITPGTLSLPSSPSTPIICIGPGTGVAPLRSMIEHRLLSSPSPSSPPSPSVSPYPTVPSNTLYFGCRSRTSDYLFASDWERMSSKEGVRVRVAFSRDQEDKVYVQHLIKEDAKVVYETIVKAKGHVYISGSSNAMPRAVKGALLFALMEEGGMGDEEGKEYLRVMEEEGRLMEECWS